MAGRPKRSQRHLDAIAAGLYELAAEDEAGNPIYRLPAGKGLVLHTGQPIGNGAKGDAAQITAAQNSAKAAKRAQAVEAYEEEITRSLDTIAYLQQRIVAAGVSEEIELSKQEVDKLKLALTASENILNRIMGRPKQQTDIKVEGSVFEEMARVVTDWEIETEVEELPDE